MASIEHALRVLDKALSCLPEGVETVRLRSDSAAYQHDLLKYCELGKNERFGRIEFAIGCEVNVEFKRAVAGVEESERSPGGTLTNRVYSYAGPPNISHSVLLVSMRW